VKQAAPTSIESAGKLQIAPGLRLPIDAVTQKLAFLGRTGSGKTYAATKLAELMHDAGAQFIALDPVGVWWGLRLGPDGKSPGLDVPIFGGLHGDISITPDSGKLLADVIVDRGISAVIDVSQFESDAQKARFAAAFGERFFYRKKAAPSAVHIFVEEAQEFVPQNLQRGEEDMLHVWQRMVKLGRNYGIGISLISQRPQEVNKKALNQSECLFVFQLTGVHERKSVKEWITLQGLDGDLNQTLPALTQGTAHVWSPAWLNINSTVKIAERRTYAAGSTPKVGERRAEPKTLTSIDLEQLEASMAETIEKAKADDPRELRKRIRELEAKSQAGTAAKVDPEALRAEYQRGKTDGARLAVKQANAAITSHGNAIVRVALDAIRNAPWPELPVLTIPDAPAVAPPQRAERSVFKPSDKSIAQQQHEYNRKRDREPGSDAQLSKSERKILGALAQYPEGRSKTQVAILTMYSHEGGGFNNALSSLRTKGFITGAPDRLQITPEGMDQAGDVEPLPVGEALLAHWLRQPQLGKAERSILSVVYGAGGRALSKEEIGAATEYEPTGGGFNNALSRLRTLGLIEGKGEIRVSPTLLEGD
jgi:hypothetical protein